MHATLDSQIVLNARLRNVLLVKAVTTFSTNRAHNAARLTRTVRHAIQQTV